MDLQALDLERFTVEAPSADPVPAAPPSAALVARRFKFLTADGQTATPLEQEALLGTNDLVEVSFLERCLLVRRCIGRIRIEGGGRRGWATGFLIAPGLVLTNHHVFPTAESVATSSIGFDYWFDVAGQRPADPDEFELLPEQFYVSDPDLDYAVVAAADRSSAGAPISERLHLRLIPETGKVKQDDFVTILQHPDGKPMQVALRENQVIRAAEGEAYLWYKADTAHGSSGAPVFNDSLQIVALHANGRIKRDNRRFVLSAGGLADTLDGLGETDVVWEANVGFRVSRVTENLLMQSRAQWPERVAELEAATRGGDVLSSTVKALEGEATPIQKRGEAPDQEQEMALERPAGRQTTIAKGDSVVIPLQLRIALEAAGQPAAQSILVSEAAAPIEAEAFEMRTPVIYDGLDSRDGFQPDFLDPAKEVPAPKITAAGQKLLAPLLDGSGNELKYQHFSVWMQRERRLALYTASNVDWRDRRKVVDGKATSREGLAGWPKGSKFAELWVDDPRIDPRHQLPDVFYSEDRGAFDKGHIVRRDDVCWGDHFADMQMANGDTFHVTNCSPQIKAFNQGQAGEENWGDLEGAIAKVTKADAQAACLFAGPIFGADDRWFHGKDERGAARIQVPSRFWKIVVVKGDEGFEAYGFVLEQDVRPLTEEEFFVTNEWLAAWKPIREIEGQLRGWLDLSELADFDQHARAGAPKA